MKLLFIAFLVTTLLVKARCDHEVFLPFFRWFKDFQLLIYGRSIENDRLRRAANDSARLQAHLPDSVPFPCFNDKFKFEDGRSKERPTSVHELRPGDIDVVGAMGDSLTAGNGAGASNILHVAVENRGVSFSIGGRGTWRQYLTLPNILKEFNPRLVGYSLGDDLPHHRGAQFNVAELGTISSDFPYMATKLVRRIASDPRVDVETHWKLITMMVGPNDFCLNVCLEKSAAEIVEQHRKDLRTTIAYLRKHLPRTLVQVVIPPDVHLLRTMRDRPQSCRLAHLFECPCMFGEAARPRARLERTRRVIARWRAADAEVVAALALEYADAEDFAVVLQPFPLTAEIPLDAGGNSDYSYLSTDCFHFSQKGYASAANALWNNMMEPTGNKSMGWGGLFDTFKCPTVERPYIYTNVNSARR